MTQWNNIINISTNIVLREMCNLPKFCNTAHPYNKDHCQQIPLSM